MKKLRYFTILFASALLVFSCNKDFLQRSPQDTISEPEFWKTANDLMLYANYLYFRLGKNAYTMDDGSDNALSNNGYSTWLSGQTQVTADVIKNTYTYIRDANTMIANMNKVTDPDAAQYKGEAYFIRAWHYFSVLKAVGPAQLVSQPLKSDDDRLFVKRSPRDSVAYFILADLDTAIARLKMKSDLAKSSDGQRISRDAALALKVRVALFEGTWEKYHNGTVFGVQGGDYNKFLRIAADAAKTFIDSYGYTLDDNYQIVFNQTTVSGTTIPVKEIIFARQFSDQLYGQGNSQFGGDNMRQWPNKVGYTREAIRSYLCTDGLPISLSPDYVGDKSLANVATNRDPRLGMSILMPGDPYSINATTKDTVRFVNPFTTVDATAQAEPTGYSSKKFYNYSLDYSGKKSRDAVTTYLRYGELLLNYAEAKAELGEFDQAAADISINKLRSRASVHMPPMIVGAIVTDPDWPDWGYTLSPVLQEIRRERRVELLGEDFRFDDLRRWRADKLIVGLNYHGAYFEAIMNNGAGKTLPKDDDNYFVPFQTQLPNGYQFDPNRDYLQPFPQNEIVLNPELEPNPGW